MLRIFWHNFWTRNARKSIKGSKGSYYSLESKTTLSHEIGSLVQRWRHTKTAKIPQSWRHRPKTPNPNIKLFFILKYKTSRVLKGFNRSLAQSAADLCLTKICPERANHTFRATFWFMSKTGFSSHYFGSRLLENQWRALQTWFLV